MNKVTQTDIELLFKQATNSPRKRAHLNLHDSFDEKVQRLYIALLKGSYVEPHYHALEHQWEMFAVQHGVLKLSLHDKTGSIIKSFLIGDGEEVQSVELQPGDVHSVECISDRALIIEIKEGPFKHETAKVLIV